MSVNSLELARWRPVAWLAAIALVAGCRRAPAGANGELLFAGEPAAFGRSATELEWDFGDGSPPRTAVRPSHAFARAGTYRVRGVRAGQVVEEERVRVEPRPFPRALPESVEWVAFLPRWDRPFEETLDFAEALAGAQAVQRWLERGGLAATATELSGTHQDVFDRAEGLGMFTLHGLPGRVSFLGVQAPDALAVVAGELAARTGAGVLEHTPGSVLLDRKDGAPALLFEDRGYLYLVEDAGPDAEASEAVREAVRRARSDGGLLERLLRSEHINLPGGQAGFFLGPRFWDETGLRRVQGVLLRGRVQERVLELQGVVYAATPLWRGGPGEPLPLALAGPEGPVWGVVASFDPQAALERWWGPEGSPERQALARTARQWGLELERLMDTLSGQFATFGYFDAPAFFALLASEGGRPQLRGGLVTEAGLSQPEVWVATVEALSARGLGRARRSDEEVSYVAQVGGQPLQARVDRRRLRLELGSGFSGRSQVNLLSLWPDRLDIEPPRGGELSGFLDVAQLREELLSPEPLEGIPADRLVTLRGMAVSFLDQLTSVDHLQVRARPVAEGAAVRAQVVLRSNPARR